MHASRPTAICSDVMAVCSVQIERTESGDRLTTSTATVVESLMINQRDNSVRLQDNIK